jgi:hypothetical protein
MNLENDILRYDLTMCHFGTLRSAGPVLLTFILKINRRSVGVNPRERLTLRLEPSRAIWRPALIRALRAR